MIRGKWAAAFSVVVFFAGCSSGGHSSARPSTRGANTSGTNAKTCSAGSSARGWVRSDLHPVTQPVVAGCDFVLYDAVGGDLRVVALDAATGRTVWQTGASSSAVTPGVSPRLAVTAGVVTILKAFGSGRTAQIVGLDERTGSLVSHSLRRSTDVNGWPEVCPDDATTVCATVSDPTNGQTAVWRFTAKTGKQLASPIISTTSSGRDVGPDLYDPGLRTPDMLVAVDRGSIAWRHPLASVFTEPGLSTDNGWNFDRVPKLGLFVGSVNGPPVSETTNSEVIDMSKTMTAGFRLRDGAPAWSNPGARYVCTELPCTGAANPTTGIPYGPQTFGLRIRGTGTITFTFKPEHATFDPGAKVVLEGFDLATGRTSWSFDAGQDLPLVEDTVPPQLGVETVLLPNSAGKLTTLNLATGATTRLASTASLWCQKPTTYTSKIPYHFSNGRTDNTYQGENATFPCDPQGHALPVPAQVPTFVGPTLNGLIAWSESNKVIAAPAAR